VARGQPGCVALAVCGPASPRRNGRCAPQGHPWAQLDGTSRRAAPGSGRSPAQRARPSGSSVPCLRIPPGRAWWSWRIAAGRLSRFRRMPRVNAAWIPFRAAGGTAYSVTGHSSCAPLPASCSSPWGTRVLLLPLLPPPARLFPPARQISLPACHRHVLVLLLPDLVLGLIETEQGKAFRPRRN
jgi:hypothetical protein